MPTNKDAISDLFRDSVGRILVIVGVFLIVIGLFHTSKMGSLVFALGLFFGVFLMDVGLVVHFELFKVKVWSREGLSTILICIAPLLIAIGTISLFFAVYDYSQAYIMPPVWQRGFVVEKDGKKLAITVVPLAHIYSWLFKPLLIAGVVLFTLGFFLRVYDAIS